MWTRAMQTWQESDLRMPYPGWVPHPPWLSTAVLQQMQRNAAYLGGCLPSCRPRPATFLQARGSVAFKLSAHGGQGTSYMSWQSTVFLCSTRLKGVGVTHLH
jgi:hypothetical protein